MTFRLKLKPVDPLESVRQKDIVGYLERHPAIAKIHRVNVGKFKYVQFGIIGHTDLLVWLKPRFGTRQGFIECKRPKEKPNEDQIEFMLEMSQRGHIVFIATNGADAWQEFSKQLKEE